MDDYKVNINDLFDSNESFLFKNDRFKRLLKRTANKFNYLVNPNFDLSEVASVKLPKRPVKSIETLSKNEKRLRDPQERITRGDLMKIYTKVFAMPGAHSEAGFPRMMHKYDIFFEEQ